MRNREIAIDVIQKLPENASLQEIAREIQFVAGVREGFEQRERGEGIPAEEVRQMIPTWIAGESSRPEPFRTSKRLSGTSRSTTRKRRSVSVRSRK